MISILLTLNDLFTNVSAKSQQLRQAEKVGKVLFHDVTACWNDVAWNDCSLNPLFFETQNLRLGIFLSWLRSKHSEAQTNRRCSTLKLEWHISWQENRKQEIDDQEISCRKLGTRKTGKTRKIKGVKSQDLEPKDIYILSFSTNNWQLLLFLAI